MTLVTVIVVATLKMVGALLVLVLIVLPAAAARNLSRSLTGFFWGSIGFGTLGTLSGLIFYATLALNLALRPGDHYGRFELKVEEIEAGLKRDDLKRPRLQI